MLIVRMIHALLVAVTCFAQFGNAAYGSFSADLIRKNGELRNRILNLEADASRQALRISGLNQIIDAQRAEINGLWRLVSEGNDLRRQIASKQIEIDVLHRALNDTHHQMATMADYSDKTLAHFVLNDAMDMLSSFNI